MTGYVLLHRKMMEWGWYKDSQTVHLFLHLLFKASWKKSEWKGIPINRGEIIVGRKTLHFETGISEQSIRTILTRLKSTNELTIKSTSRFSVITICNYESYQNVKNEINQQTNQQTNQQSTTSKELKNIKENKNNTYSVCFETFWNRYPRKVGKDKAWQSWSKLKCDINIELILTALDWQIKQESWVKDSGRFIPHPTTYLNQGRWKDEKNQKINLDSAFEQLKKWGVK